MHRDIDTMPVVCPIAVVARERVPILNGRRVHARFRKVIRNRISAAIGQLRIDGRRQRRQLEVARIEVDVVGDEEVLEPPARIADFERRAWKDLVLNRDAQLPVAWPHTPAVEHVRVHERERVRVREISKPRNALSVRFRLKHVAVGNVIADEIEERSRRSRLEIRHAATA